MDGECPTSTADLGDTFIHHSDSFSGSLVASCAPLGNQLRSLWLTLSLDFLDCIHFLTRSSLHKVEDIRTRDVLEENIELLNQPLLMYTFKSKHLLSNNSRFHNLSDCLMQHSSGSTFWYMRGFPLAFPFARYCVLFGR